MSYEFIKLILLSRSDIPRRLLQLFLIKSFHLYVVLLKAVDYLIFEIAEVCCLGILICQFTD